MNDLIDAFKDFYGSNYDKNKSYLFLVEKPKSGSKCGYMPLTRRFGFIFTDQCTDELAHTIAHELGHGPFHLYHTFSTENGFTQAQGSTDNLMDYSGASATSLYKYQWDHIQDPQGMIGLLQGDEEGDFIKLAEIEITELNEVFAPLKTNYKCSYKIEREEAITDKDLHITIAIKNNNGELCYSATRTLKPDENNGEFIWNGLINTKNRPDTYLKEFELPLQVTVSCGYKNKITNKLELVGLTRITSKFEQSTYNEPDWLSNTLLEGDAFEQAGDKIYNDVLVKNELFHLSYLWDNESKEILINKIKPYINEVFPIKKNENNEYEFDNDLFCKRNNIEPDDIYLETNHEVKNKRDRLKWLSLALIDNAEQLLSQNKAGYDQSLEDLFQVFYNNKKKEYPDGKTYTWIDATSGEIIDPRNYFKDGEYDFTSLENDVKEYVLLKEPKYVNPPDKENEAGKLAQYNVLLSMYGEYMYRIGIQDLPEITSSKIEELKPKFYNYWELTEIQQGKYAVEWRTLRDIRWEREREEWLAKLRGAEALKIYLEAMQAGKVQAIKDIIIGTGGATISGIVIGTSEFTFELDLALGLAGMGYSLDRVSGGISKLKAINNKVFDPNKEYRLVKGIVVDNFGETGALIYDIGNLIVNIRGVSGILKGSDMNTLIDYLAMGMDSYEILEFINAKIESNE